MLISSHRIHDPSNTRPDRMSWINPRIHDRKSEIEIKLKISNIIYVIYLVMCFI